MLTNAPVGWIIVVGLAGGTASLLAAMAGMGLSVSMLIAGAVMILMQYIYERQKKKRS